MAKENQIKNQTHNLAHYIQTLVSAYQIHVGDVHASSAAVQQVVNDVEQENAEPQRSQHNVRVDVIVSVLA